MVVLSMRCGGLIAPERKRLALAQPGLVQMLFKREVGGGALRVRLLACSNGFPPFACGVGAPLACRVQACGL
jgi:hypothetical protein